MKKIFVFLLLMVVSFALKAQYPITQNLGSNNTLIRLGSTYGGALKGNLIQGVYADTTEANTGYIDLYPGAIIFSTGNATMYVRNAAADGWIALATGLSAINIYTSDGTLTGNRTLAGVGNSLTFSGLSDFLVEDATGEIKLGTSEFNRLRISSGFTAFISLDADSLLMTRLPQSQLLSTDSVLVRTADFKVKTRAVSSIGSTYTAGNGLTLSGSQFKLGGTLTEPTIITGSGTNLLKLDGYTSANVGYLGIGTDFGYIRFGDGGAFSPTYENEIYGGVSQIGLKTTGDIYLDAGDIYTIGIPTVSSTTGRKVALIDTATGKVERIDPALLVSTPTLQQVMDAGSEALVNNEIIISSLTDPVSINSVQQLALSGVSGSVQSTVTVFTDSIFIMPHLGQLNIDSLRTWSGISDTTYKKPMTWDTRNGRWEYAANWYGGGGTPSGSNKQVQYNNSGSFGGAAGLEVTNSNIPVRALSQATTDTVLQIKTVASQTGDPFNIVNQNNKRLFAINSSGFPQVYDGAGNTVANFRVNSGVSMEIFNTGGLGMESWGVVRLKGSSLPMVGKMAITNSGAYPTANHTVDVQGSFGAAITTTSTNLTLDDTHHTVIVTSGTPTITLPAAASGNSRRIYVIVNQTGSGVTISSYLDFTGAGNTTVAANSAIQIQSNGTNWYRIL